MTKEIFIALVIAGALAIGGAVVLWTTDETTQTKVTTQPLFEQMLDSFDDYDSEIPIEEDITRILMDDDNQDGDDDDDDIREILLEKVIINEEIKAIKDINPTEK
ncbi:MAG: hypothetical protein QS748_06815 [Candidatus Endonucleobacter bathymodioli]|uniref:Uncharacterized protein n=1 Tax=Candidatus Endonucleibacter bathymodioli TaxID=539814 RepID=A0AA90NLT2_9GAMM|nr:hypothetical protein [Candidatus Endonucleobacter bathymodioli]